MPGPEATIEKAICAYAKRHGWLAYKFTSPAQRAVPDRLFIRNGVVIFVEFKAPWKKPTTLQAHVHAEMRAAGAWVFVIDSIEAGRALFDQSGPPC